MQKQHSRKEDKNDGSNVTRVHAIGPRCGLCSRCAAFTKEGIRVNGFTLRSKDTYTTQPTDSPSGVESQVKQTETHRNGTKRKQHKREQAYPTEARERETQQKNEGYDAKKKQKLVEEHYDELGDDLSALGKYRTL